MAVDAFLNIYINVTSDMVVYDKVIARRVMEKLPYMATENILMESVKRGGNRQELHEKIREYSHKATYAVKMQGKANNLIESIAADPDFPMNEAEIKAQLNPEMYVGRAPSQTVEFNEEIVKPVLDKYYKGEVKSVLSV